MVEPNSRQGGSSFSRLLEPDGWRGISILFVIVGHLFNRRYGSHPDIDLPNLPGVLSVWGVNIFFVVSGFIITKLALAERENSGTFSVREFYIRRFFRIVPPFYTYLVATGLAGAVGFIDQPIWWTAAAASFTCNLSIASCGWFAGHSWTLAFEEQFYLTFPLVFCLFGMSPKRTFLGLFLLLPRCSAWVGS